MSTVTATRTEPTVTPRAASRLGRWLRLALVAMVITGVAVLAVRVLGTPGDETAAATFDADAAYARLVSIGYLTEEGVREYEATRSLQNRGFVPTAPSEVGQRGSTEEAETRRLVSRGLIPSGTRP